MHRFIHMNPWLSIFHESPQLIWVITVGLVLVCAFLLCMLLRMHRSNKKTTGIWGNTHFSFGRLHCIGSRDEQEDAYAISDFTNDTLCRRRGVLAIIADGMGGLQGGADISTRITAHFLSAFTQGGETDDGQALLSMTLGANDAVNRFLAADERRKSGSTLAAVILRADTFHFISVGDSRIYLLRERKLTQVNRDHNLQSILDERAIRGEITFDEARSNLQAAALTSYVGMGNPAHLDRSFRPIPLYPGDKVLLMTDGIYNTLEEDEIIALCNLPPQEASSALETAIHYKGRPGQDNYTAIIIARR